MAAWPFCWRGGIYAAGLVSPLDGRGASARGADRVGEVRRVAI